MKLSLPPKTLLLPSPVLIIGTYGSDGKPNMMNAAWGGIVSSKPPCISVSLREALAHTRCSLEKLSEWWQIARF